MEKKGVLVLGIMILALMLLCGCTEQAAHITMRANIAVNGSDLARNPVPFSIHLEAENTGTADVNDVSAEIIFSFQNNDIKTQTVDLGDIKPGDTGVRDVVVLVPFPDGQPAITTGALNMRIDNIYANGKKQTDVIIT
jgi:hypothetical protein